MRCVDTNNTIDKAASMRCEDTNNTIDKAASMRCAALSMVLLVSSHLMLKLLYLWCCKCPNTSHASCFIYGVVSVLTSHARSFIYGVVSVHTSHAKAALSMVLLVS